MAFLVADVINNSLKLRVAIGKCPKPSCQEKRPGTQPRRLMKLVDPFFTSRTRSDKAIEGLRPSNRCQELLISLPHNASHVFVKFFLPLFRDHIGTTLTAKT